MGVQVQKSRPLVGSKKERFIRTCVEHGIMPTQAYKGDDGEWHVRFLVADTWV
jgi:hypothetical protein